MDNNPILQSDFPDPDVIRVDDTYYMASTTMHFFPGCSILRSYDLLHWEIISHVFQTLDDTPAQRLEGDRSIYGQGMWAPCLRCHDGEFLVCFTANDTKKTYLFRSRNIKGPWKKQYIEGFYHDNSLLFDDDGRVYVVYGNNEIFITELKKDLTGPLPGGLHKMILKDRDDVRLGYEGAHIYKIRGKYYLFLIHWHSGDTGKRVEACFCSDSLEAAFTGGDVLDDDMGYFNNGVAQGGIVDTPEGNWYGILFQDRGAIGRVPVVVPVRWEGDFPRFGNQGKVPARIETKSTRPGHGYGDFYCSEDFRKKKDGSARLNPAWQWNHQPRKALWEIDREGSLVIRSGRLSPNLTRTFNVLTQRSTGPRCAAEVTVYAQGLAPGDFTGICALQGRYGMAALTREEDGYYLVMKGRPGEADYTMGRTCDNSDGVEYARIPWASSKAVLKVELNFEDRRDEANFFYRDGESWTKIGSTQKLYFGLDHFVGCRVGLFVYSTKEYGGTGKFRDFRFITAEGFNR